MLLTLTDLEQQSKSQIDVINLFLHVDPTYGRFLPSLRLIQIYQLFSAMITTHTHNILCSSWENTQLKKIINSTQLINVDYIGSIRHSKLVNLLSQRKFRHKHAEYTVGAQVEYILVKTSRHLLLHWLHDLTKVWFLKVRDILRKAISKECNVLKVNCTIKDSIQILFYSFQKDNIYVKSNIFK